MSDPTAGGGDPNGGGGGDFLTSLPVELQSQGTLKGFAGPEGHIKLARSYDELTRKFSSRDMTEMDPPSDPAKRKAVLAKLGHAPPETPDAYGIPDDGLGKDLRASAHKHGLTVDQAKGLFGDLEGARTAQRKGFEERQAAAAKEAETALRGEWGDQYDAKMQLANRALEQFLPEATRKKMEVAGFNHDPAMVKLMADLGRALQEGTMHTGSGTSTGPQTVQQLRSDRVKLEKEMADMQRQDGFDSAGQPFRDLLRRRQELLSAEGKAHIEAAQQGAGGGAV